MEYGRKKRYSFQLRRSKTFEADDEYVGKIQDRSMHLRADGSDKVSSLKNQIAIVKENKNLTKEEKR